jgi:hypothetical protein
VARHHRPQPQASVQALPLQHLRQHSEMVIDAAKRPIKAPKRGKQTNDDEFDDIE